MKEWLKRSVSALKTKVIGVKARIGAGYKRFVSRLKARRTTRIRSTPMWSFVVTAIAVAVGTWYFPKVLLSILSLTAMLGLLGYYTAYALAKSNIFLTEVEAGWCRLHMRRGKYVRTLGPGWHWIGLPGINTLFKRPMKFLKSVTDENGNALAEIHPTAEELKKDKGAVDQFKTTRYPYAVPFANVEDSNGLYLHGLLSVYGTVRNYEKAFFRSSDWNTEMVAKVLSCFTDLLGEVAYDEDITGGQSEEKKKEARVTVSVRLWEMLNSPQSEDRPSVIEWLLNETGFEIGAVELRSIDPPAEWRQITLEPYLAERRLAAAQKDAEAKAVLLDDTNRALEVWKKGNPSATPEQIDHKQRELRDRALSATPGYRQVDIRGAEGASTIVIGSGGSGTGVLVDGRSSGGGRRSQSDRDDRDSDGDGGDEDAKEGKEARSARRQQEMVVDIRKRFNVRDGN